MSAQANSPVFDVQVDVDTDADAFKPAFERTESHMTALTESTDAITNLDTPLTTPSLIDQQTSFLTIHQPSIDIRRVFVTLIDDLSAAFREGQLAEALQAYTHSAVLVVDEVGYLTYGTDAANMLFHVVNERHRRHRSGRRSRARSAGAALLCAEPGWGPWPHSTERRSSQYEHCSW